MKGTGKMSQQLRALASLPNDPHGSSQLPVTPVPGDPVLTAMDIAYRWDTDIYTNKIFMHIKIKF